MSKALNQLILRYLTWRDTRSAIVLFIQGGDATIIISKAIAVIENHPHFIRRGPAWSDDRYDFVFRAEGDPLREIQLALIAFVVSRRKQI